MKLASLRSIAASTLVAGAVLVACSSGDSSAPDLSSLLDGGTGSSSGGGSTYDSGGSAYDSGGYQYDSGTALDTGSGSAPETGTTGSCGSCTMDSDCQSSCPPVAGGGTNCCDIGSGVCYATTVGMCPVPSDGGGPG
jgi:hypothetical protein